MYRARILVVVYMLIHFITYLFKTFVIFWSIVKLIPLRLFMRIILSHYELYIYKA